MNDPLELKKIDQLLDKQFFIPHYQRGYRWTNQQVVQLLEDIDNFFPKEIPGKTEKTFYCLQPIVVKKMSDVYKASADLEGDWYEVIDGQQRLTTIYLIINYGNIYWTGPDKSEKFKISYETRLKCVEFFDQLSIESDDKVKINKDNIDFFHISSAFQAIRSWELEKRNSLIKFYGARFFEKFLGDAKIIWYEVLPEENSRNLFERLNLGKIPLTNAELTKALFLSENSFKDYTLEERKIKQIEIAHLWDEIEQTLNDQDQKFWSFITNKNRAAFDSKIELILDMISGKQPTEKDPLYTFLQFWEKQKEQKLDEIWSEIERFYFTLQEWFKDRNLYHKIGYLIAAKPFKKFENPGLAGLAKVSMKKKKQDFDKVLNLLIQESLAFEITELVYRGHNSQLFNALLFFNVETIRDSKSIDDYYPFKQHKGNHWSIEHIHARNSENFEKTKKEPWNLWLSVHQNLLQELADNPKDEFDTNRIQKLILEIEKYNTTLLTWDRFNSLFQQVNDLFVNDQEIDKDSEGISNLALLSQPDNAALNNAVFEIKRRVIINLDIEGSFIPICTRRLFMKYYTKDGINSQYYFWSANDRFKYLEEIKQKLYPYLPKNAKYEEDEIEHEEVPQTWE
ncbi:DUF262 domain-containing protein [Aquiflexum gelatinilyticum]|uniref:DUF262 domain-containing protein n=1 Tax=Aquiflexum gelatinilyticum TaxID=2961943 RepID=UPI0021679527|nr:DUF262 domain-containing protein [Aquiflexum gelatinilyticum]MCS4432865.1 DUF262 domain-containing protein [Aquiflexum gelatinilyticum]